MSIVITGAAGFLGQALMRRFAQAGGEVVGVSRRSRPGLVQVASYEEAPEGEVLIHLAETSDRHGVNQGGADHAARSHAALRRLVAKSYGRIVYASSAVLYGDAADAPRGVDDPIYLVDTYSHLKRTSEEIVLEAGGIVARLSNLFGPGMAGGNVLSTIIGQLSNPGPISVLDATPVRDFLWVDDAADALQTMARSRATGIFNVGSGVGTSILELAQAVLMVAGQPYRSVESRQSGTRRSCLVVDNAVTTATFGWRPQTKLHDGIRSLINEC